MPRHSSSKDPASRSEIPRNRLRPIFETGSPRLIAGSIVVIALAHYLFFFSGAYWAHRWLDTPMHLVCGMWFSWFFAYFLFDRGLVSATRPIYEALVIIALVALVGVLWEFHEFVADIYIRNRAWIMQAGVGDTMGDLLNDIAGGTIPVIIRFIPWQSISRSGAARN